MRPNHQRLSPVSRHHDFFASNASRYDDSRPPLLSDSPLAALIGTAALASQALILDVATGTGRVPGDRQDRSVTYYVTS
jgi:hypothetical protein